MLLCNNYVLVLVGAVATLSGAIPTPGSRHVVHEQRRSLQQDWIRGNRVDKSAILPMRIGLTQSNLDKGDELLMEVYGQWYSAEEVHDLFSPSEETVSAVTQWLTLFGFDASQIVHSENKGWLAFDAAAEQAEALLMAEFHEYEHKSSGKTRIGCDKYHLPEHLTSHIDYIKPGIKLVPIVKRSVSKKSAPAGRVSLDQNPFVDQVPWGWKSAAAEQLSPELQDCGRNITPPCYRALYQIPQPTTALPGHSLGLYEQGDYFSKEDLDLFYAQHAPYIPQGTYPIPALIDGAQYDFPANNTDMVGGEADIDIDIATSLIYPQTVTLYQVDDQIYAPKELATTNLFNTFLDALDGSYCTYTAYGETGNDPKIDAVYPNPNATGYQGQLQCGVYTPTKVISMSYGQAENDLPVNYTKRQCNEFMKLGLQGHSILVSSGDYGVASFPGDGTANGCLGPDSTIFNPQYPDNCPYLTVVGATMLYPDQTVLDAESVMHVNLSGTAANFSSAGGFSNYFAQPDYQKEAVAHYFANYEPSYPSYEEFEPNFTTIKGLYNKLGRAYPDVSANGANLRAYTNGADGYWFGTSLASPLFASVLTLLNQEREAIGKGPVGFVNPVLYANPGVLNDITNGTSAGCNTDGFSAVPGWDPATGLGTPNYPKMKSLFLGLP